LELVVVVGGGIVRDLLKSLRSKRHTERHDEKRPRAENDLSLSQASNVETGTRY